VAVSPVLGSRSTYLPTGLGGFRGRRLAAGDVLPVGPAPAWSPPPGTTGPEFEPSTAAVRIVPGPQRHLFTEAVQADLERHAFAVGAASDRMGTRLVGPAVVPSVRAANPSEATCLGAVQVPDGGQPIVLLADGPTVGGYPKLAAVIGADLGRFVQIPPGGEVRFEWVTVADAQRALADSAERLARRLTAIRLTARPG
jgi:allophanate hydrolase subunit 2